MQVIVGRPVTCKTQDDFERLLMVARKYATRMVRESVKSAEEFYVCSFSSRTLLYKGMLTPAQLDELRAARGEVFDRTFLRLMIQHHNGAVSMVTELFATDGAAQDDLVFKLASDIQVDQITEVARMERMLEEMGSGR